MLLDHASSTNYHLPNELLTQIFLADWSNRVPGEYSLRALTLSNVCSRWRAVTLSLPQLWSTIYILPHESPDSHNTISFVQLYLDRSGDALLEVFIGSSSPRLLEMVLRHSRRWQMAHLVLDLGTLQSLDVLDMSSAHLDGGFPFLESLYLASESGGAGSAVRGSDVEGYDSPVRRDLYSAKIRIRLFNHAPRLHKLYIDMPSLRLDQLELPWAQIRFLSMMGLKMDVVHAATRLCSNSIVSARFEQCGEDFSYSEPVQYVCSLLEDLSIKVDGTCATLGNDFTTFLLPKLRGIEISSEAPGKMTALSDSVILDLTALLIRSSFYDESAVNGSRLQRLTLSGIDYASHQLLRLLQATPHLTKLDLCDVGYKSRNFRQLNQEAILRLAARDEKRSGESTVITSRFLPRLKEFGIDVPRISADSSNYRKLECLYAMIESRFPRHPPQPTRSSCPHLVIAAASAIDDDYGLPVFSMGSSGIRDSDFLCTTLHGVDLGPFWASRLPVETRERLYTLQSRGLVIAPSVVQGGY